MNKGRRIIFTLLSVTSCLFASCSKGQQDEIVWSKWYDNGDGLTHSRHNINKLTQEETEPHHFVIQNYIVQPTETTPGEALYECDKCEAKETRKVQPTGNYVFDQEVVAEEFLYKKCSEHSAIYYKSSVEGAYGNPDELFEYSDIPSDYSEVGYVESDGRQFIDTGIAKSENHTVKINGKSDKLPDEYEELEYIEANGTQSIDTGYPFDLANDEVEIKVESTNPNVNAAVFATNETEIGGCHFWFYQYAVEQKWILYIHGDNVETTVLGNNIPDTNVHVLEFKNHQYLFDGELIGRVNGKGITESNIYVCSGRDNYYFQGKLYYCKFYKSGTLARDYVPCTRKSDGINGLYDLVTNEFFTNRGTSNFIAGEKKNNSNRNHLSEEEKSIPSFYKQANYVESHHNSIIDTGVYGNARLEMQVQFFNKKGGQAFGYGSDSGELYGTYNGYYLGTSIKCGNIDTISVDFGETEENVTRATINNVTEKEYNCPDLSEKSLRLFGSGDSLSSDCLLYYAKVYKEGKLVRDFVPVVLSDTGDGGLFDLIEEKLYLSDIGDTLIPGGLAYSGIDKNNISIFIDRDSNIFKPRPQKVSAYQIFEDDNLLRDFVSVIRNSDSKAGFYDLVTSQFYYSPNEYDLKTSEPLMHTFGEGKVIKNATHSEDGEIVYKCTLCGHEVHRKTERTSYKVTFMPSFNLPFVKIFESNDPNKFENSLVAYTRNINTYNYSKFDAYVLFTFDKAEDKEYKITTTKGRILEREDGTILIDNIMGDCYVRIFEK